MEGPKGKFAWTVKLGEKGQFVIPKEARELFGFRPGDTIMVLADKDRGIAILPKKTAAELTDFLFNKVSPPASGEEAAGGNNSDNTDTEDNL